MNESESTARPPELQPATVQLTEVQPLPYHISICDYLRNEESQIWTWFDSESSNHQQDDAVRLELLKSTYRLDPAENAALYEDARVAAERLALDVPLTIYQAQTAQSMNLGLNTPSGLNASIAYLPDQVHIILHGDVAAKLESSQLRALMGHELSHFLFWRQSSGQFHTAHRILTTMCHDAHAHPAHFATLRLFSLYTEIFCDRGACRVVDSAETVVAMLVKIQTNLEQVSGASYIRQAAEIFEQGVTATSELTHPEAYIRARALQLWADDDQQCEDKIQQMIEGTLALQELDLLAQRKASALTRRVIDVFLAPKQLQTETMLAFVQAFFADYQFPRPGHEDADLESDLRTDDSSMQDYYCYLLLDLTTADRDLEELPLTSALLVSEQLGLKTRFIEAARKELRLRKKQIEKIDKEKVQLLAGLAAATKQA